MAFNERTISFPKKDLTTAEWADQIFENGYVVLPQETQFGEERQRYPILTQGLSSVLISGERASWPKKKRTEGRHLFYNKKHYQTLAREKYEKKLVKGKVPIAEIVFYGNVVSFRLGKRINHPTEIALVPKR